MTKRVKRPKRTREELMIGIEHVSAEMMTLFMTVRLLRKHRLDEQKKGAEEVFTIEAILMLFCVTARGLIEFLYDERPQVNDVSAEDFFADRAIWRENRPPIPDILRTTRELVGREVVHITYHRPTNQDEATRWYFRQIANEIRDVMVEFKRLIPEEFRKVF